MEDVDYILQHSVIDSKVFYVDSAVRDKITFPSPGNYQWLLNSPLRNVCGFEILDSAIPVTMYNIDFYNNIFVYARVFGNLLLFWPELEENSVFVTAFNVVDSHNFYVREQSMLPYTSFNTTTTITSNILFTRSVVTSTSIKSISSSASADAGYYKFAYRLLFFEINDTDPYFHIITSGDFSLTTSPITLIYYASEYISDADAHNFNIKPTSLKSTYGFDVTLINSRVDLEVGNYDILSLQSYLAAVLPLTITQTSVFGDITKQSRIRFTNEYNFYIDIGKSTCRDVMGFSANLNNNAVVSVTNQVLYLASLINKIYVLDSSGLVNLMGVRFIILRCPELESHINGSFGYGNYNPGIGLFKLSHGNDVTHQRFDFTNSVVKPFYPVGKLIRLTFMFEFEYHGNIFIYDFKGCDHNMVINVKMYVPIKTESFKTSILNPNYDADFLRYKNTHSSSLALESKGEDEEIDEEMVLREQQKYDRSLNMYEND